MKKTKRISLITAGALATTMTVPTTILVSCKKNVEPDSEGISVSTKDVEINHDTGVGTFDIILDEQPVDNEAYVYIITAEGGPHVELLAPEPSVYHGTPAYRYGVDNGIATVNIGFTQFVGKTAETDVCIQVRYNNRKGEWILKTVNNIKVGVHYVQNKIEEVHLFSINDLHGVAEGYGEDKSQYPNTNSKDPGVIRLMDKISPTIDSHPGSFMVAAGDSNSGDVFSSSVHGESIFKVMKSMGIRYSAVGNHAFEWGLSPMATYQFDKWARTDETIRNYFLASNILNGNYRFKDKWVSDPDADGFEEDYATWQSQRVVWADPYKIVNMNGHLVCLIGLTTNATIEDGNKTVVDNLSFIDYDAALNYSIYNCQQNVAKQLFDSIESFVLLTHIESEQETKGGEVTGAAAELAGNFDGILNKDKVDAVISGHSHKLVDGRVYNPYVNHDVLVGQASTEGRAYLDLTFRFDNTKPVGHKKIEVSQHVEDITLPYQDDTEENYEAARQELDNIKKSPRTQTVSNVISAFGQQTSLVQRKLNEVLKAKGRKDTLLYPAVTSGKTIGHEFYINQRPETGAKPKDGGYVIDQLGAWINYANILGFASKFKEEIEASTTGFTYPAISFINQDSIKTQMTDHNDQGIDVKLRDMYSIQTFENPTYFGFISLWQLADIINFQLAGDDEAFNYNSPSINYYDPRSTSEQSLNNLCVFNAGEQQFDTCDPSYFTARKYKTMENCYNLYACGPIQSYGYAFGVEPVKNKTLNPHRTWQLRMVDAVDPDLGISQFPDIYIMDPTDDPETEGEDNLYSTVNPRNVKTQWLSAEQYYKKYKDRDYDTAMIPTVINSFLYQGANNETLMVSKYMEYNQKLNSISYPIVKFSEITRDLMTEFATSNQAFVSAAGFDMPISIVEQIVQYHTEQ